jgi:TM2 domain-containing membrane protein YozV
MNNDPVWVIEDPDDLPFVRKKKKPPVVTPPRRPQKSPAVAFSLSLLVWGAGQIYNRQGKIGLLLSLLMANFYLGLGLLWLYGTSITAFLGAYHITPSHLMMAASAFYLSGLMLWFFSAQQAYHRANKKRTDPFRGVENRFYPAFCSLLIPGWGQYLNGQAKKGSFFLMLTMIAFFVFPALLVIPSLWPMLKTAMDRRIWESYMVAALFLTPLVVLLVWPLSAFDALKISLDDTKKEPLLKRIEYANNRRRMRGWTEGVFPHAKLTLLLGLFLAICVTVSYYYFPREYYFAQLQSIQVRLSQENMVLIPRLIDRLFQGVSHKGRRKERGTGQSASLSSFPIQIDDQNRTRNRSAGGEKVLEEVLYYNERLPHHD